MIIVEEEMYDLSQWYGTYGGYSYADDESYYTFKCPHCEATVTQFDGPAGSISGVSCCSKCKKAIKHMSQLFYNQYTRIRFHHKDIISLVPSEIEGC